MTFRFMVERSKQMTKLAALRDLNRKIVVITGGSSGLGR
ncbi:hypothetical protein OA78_2367, partial [Latilactobacillus curvatus]